MQTDQIISQRCFIPNCSSLFSFPTAYLNQRLSGNRDYWLRSAMIPLEKDSVQEGSVKICWVLGIQSRQAAKCDGERKDSGEQVTASHSEPTHTASVDIRKTERLKLIPSRSRRKAPVTLRIK